MISSLITPQWMHAYLMSLLIASTAHVYLRRRGWSLPEARDRQSAQRLCAFPPHEMFLPIQRDACLVRHCDHTIFVPSPAAPLSRRACRSLPPEGSLPLSRGYLGSHRALSWC